MFILLLIVGILVTTIAVVEFASKFPIHIGDDEY
jgi:hypothetical protein